MILSDKDILEILDKDKSLISPFKEERLRGASYDVMLDGEITPMRSNDGVIDLSDQDAIDTTYSPQLSVDGFVMKPGQYCLAALAETISLPDDIAAFVEPRTRYTRMGLIVFRQFCNPSYAGRLQIGLYNASGNNLKLASYMPIAQLVFHRLSSAPSEKKLYRLQESAVYHNEGTFIGGRAERPLSEDEKKIYESLVNELSAYEFDER